jgi:hypothetical protein
MAMDDLVFAATAFLPLIGAIVVLVLIGKHKSMPLILTSICLLLVTWPNYHWVSLGYNVGFGNLFENVDDTAKILLAFKIPAFFIGLIAGVYGIIRGMIIHSKEKEASSPAHER